MSPNRYCRGNVTEATLTPFLPDPAKAVKPARELLKLVLDAAAKSVLPRRDGVNGDLQLSDHELAIGQYRWNPAPPPAQAVDFLAGMRAMTTAGDARGEHGANPDVVEEVYRAMISRFVSLEMDEHNQNKANKEEGL